MTFANLFGRHDFDFYFGYVTFFVIVWCHSSLITFSGLAVPDSTVKILEGQLLQDFN